MEAPRPHNNNLRQFLATLLSTQANESGSPGSISGPLPAAVSRKSLPIWPAGETRALAADF